jgi:segregation and condensation protein B
MSEELDKKDIENNEDTTSVDDTLLADEELLSAAESETGDKKPANDDEVISDNSERTEGLELALSENFEEDEKELEDFLKADDEIEHVEGVDSSLSEEDGWQVSESEGVDFVEEEPFEDGEAESGLEVAVEQNAEIENSELGAFEAAEIEEEELIEEERLMGIIESLLFATDKPLSLESIRQVFKGTNIKKKEVKKAIHAFGEKLSQDNRGVELHEVAGGYQLRTKPEFQEYLRRQVKGRPFRLSGPALEVMAITAYKQPCIKAEVDEIRGVESGHLMRALMDKSLIRFAGKSDLPGKPMLYQTTKKFLEIFGLKSLNDLPSLGEIDELIPEGIGDEEEEKEVLGDITEKMSVDGGTTYSQGEDQLTKIADQIKDITTTSDFFEQEKQRMRDKRDRERAQDIRDAMLMNEAVEEKDIKWLERYERKIAKIEAEEAAAKEAAEAEAARDAEADNSASADAEVSEDTDNVENAVLDASADTEAVVAETPVEEETAELEGTSSSDAQEDADEDGVDENLDLEAEAKAQEFLDSLSEDKEELLDANADTEGVFEPEEEEDPEVLAAKQKVESENVDPEEEEEKDVIRISDLM